MTKTNGNDNDKEREGVDDVEGKQHLVFDLFHDVKKGWDSHFGTIIVQESPYQVYKIPSLHNTLHYTIRGKANMERRIKDLIDDGYKLLTEQCLRSTKRPRRFLIIVPPGKNLTGVKEIEVINFGALGDNGNGKQEQITGFGEKARALFEEIPFDRLADYLVKEQSFLHSKRDNRNSRNLSAGYSQQRQTNTSMYPGMNTPEFTNSTDKLPQIDKDSGKTVTQSMLSYGCILLKLSDLIARETGSPRAFTDTGRVAMFMGPVAERHKIAPKHLRFEGVTIGNTGLNPLMCEEHLAPHFDSGNDTRTNHGQHFVVCANKIVEVEYKQGKTVRTRTAVIIYSKKCVGDCYDRLTLYEPIALKYEKWIEDCHPVLDVNPVSINALGLSDKPSQLHMISPQWTKRFYYSPYINEILRVGKESNWDGILMLEAAYATAFTPNAKTFCHGVALALEESTQNENFIFRYINSVVGVYGSVSGGEGRRRMCSHQRSVSRYRVMKSLANLPRLLEIVNTPGIKTTDVIKEFAKSPEKGGMFLMGQLSCQEFLHILTMVSKVIHKNKFISNESHMNNVAISTSTKTSKRLESNGIASDSDRKKLLQFLRRRLAMLYSTQETAIDDESIENGLCESLRYHSGIHVHEYIGDTVYTEKDGKIVAYNLRGEKIDLRKRFGKPVVSLPTRNRHQGVMWWVTGQLKLRKHLALDGDILLTTKQSLNTRS